MAHDYETECVALRKRVESLEASLNQREAHLQQTHARIDEMQQTLDWNDESRRQAARRTAVEIVGNKPNQVGVFNWTLADKLVNYILTGSPA